MKIKQLVTFIALAFFQKFTFAATPNWSVNPPSFNYSMTVTAVTEINCNELTNPSNIVGAFVGNDCRGTALTSNIVNGRYIASMIVYSNVVSGETITFKIYNSATDSVYDAKVTVLFQDDASYGVSTSPFVIKNNNQPTNISLSSLSVNEGLPVNTVVGALTSVDIDSGETFTYSLVNGTGSADNGNFVVSGGNLVTNAVFDYSVKSSHNIRIRTTDVHGCFFEKQFTIAINDVNTPPTGILISDSTIDENKPALSVVGVLSAIDYDANESFSYTLVSGAGSTDNSLFNINGANLRTLSVFNYEAKSSYSIRVKVTDALSNTFERQITILINDVNDLPTAILLNDSTNGISFAENQNVGSLIGIFKTIDPDTFDNFFIYTFVNTAGNNNDKFTIAGNQLRTNDLFDYETRSSYVIFVQTNDGHGGLLTQQFTLTVTDSNDAPTAMALTNSSVNENSPAHTYVGRFITTDPDNISNFTYSFVTGAGSGGNSNFSISNDSLFTVAIFDYEHITSYTIRVNVNDGFGGNYQQTLNITINNINDEPTDINLTSNQIAENLAANTLVGTLSTNDQDQGNTFIYTLVSGSGSTDNGSFNIAGNSLRASVSFDYETKNSYSIRIRTTDNFGASFDKIFNIEVTDMPDPPTNIVLSSDSIKENRPVNTLIGTFSGISQDGALTFTYAFDNTISGNNNSSFTITGNQLRSNMVFDYETKNSYLIYVTASDGAGGLFTKQFEVSIKDSNDAPTDIALSMSSITEDRPVGSFIGTFSSSDPDFGNTFTYSLVGGTGSTNNNIFTLRHDTLYTAVLLDYEQQSSYSIRVQTTDNYGLSFQKIFTITVNNSNDFPTAINLSATAINENMPFGSTVGTFSTVDEDAGQTFTYSLVGGVGSANNNAFSIQNGVLKTNIIFNYEVKNSYTIRVQTNDGHGGTFSDTFNITINDANDAPTNITLNNNSIPENRLLASVIGTFITTDEDTADRHTYTLANISGNENSSFFINGNQLFTNANFDFETKRIYNIYVSSSDGQSSITKQFVINITDSNDVPTSLSLTNQSVSENLPVGSLVGILQTNDPDPNETFTYSLVSGTGALNNTLFQIRNDSLLTNAIFDYESKTVYNVRLRVTDHGGLYIEMPFVINIINANDEPTDIRLSSTEITENRLNRSRIGLLSSVDEDVNDNFSYALVSGQGSTDNSSFVITGNELRANRVFNYELKNSYDIRIQTNDGNGGVFEKTFTITIIDSNDVPTNILFSTNIIVENAPIGTKVCDLITIDEDSAEEFSYSFVNVSGNNNSDFMIVGSELRTATVFDYESKNIYLIHLQTTDLSGGIFTKQFVIYIKDTNDAPIAMDLNNTNVDENMPERSLVGMLTAIDPDFTDNLTYSLVTGTGSIDNGSFVISADSLLTNAIFNYEAKSIYRIRLRVSDNHGGTFDKQFTININDVNDIPSGLALDGASLIENSPKGTEIGTFRTIDEDGSDTYSYLFANGGADNASFAIVGNKLFNTFVPDFETKSIYSIRVKSIDKGGDSVIADFSIAIIDISEKPSINDFKFSVSENAASGFVIGTVSATSPDAGATFKYFLLNEANVPFSLDENTGEVSVSGKLDYEKQEEYKLALIVQDDQSKTLADSSTLTISLIDEIEAKNDLPVNNYMSPNGDGINDFFTISNVELYKDFSLTIYNAGGMEVYKINRNYNNDWDGTYNGSALPMGVYFYVLYNSTTGDEFKGAINIMK